MTKWEYKTIIRSRGWARDKDSSRGDWMKGTEWNLKITTKLEELGEQGWELVTVISRSSYLGSHTYSGTDDYAGFTSDEVWVFKRPKQ